MIDLISTFILFTPIYLFFFLGIGIPWALALLPREDWRDRPTVFATGLALGPILGTTWLFVQGTFFTFSLPLVVGGPVVVSMIGGALAWRRMRIAPEVQARSRSRVGFPAVTLWGVIALGAIVHVGAVIFWPFIYYDTLWTYGSDPRIFLTWGQIPDWIEYYPKLLHLTYSFGTFINGAIDDHVARAAIPWFVMGSVSMAYLLGYRVWGKHIIGLVAAALWFLTPAMFFWTFSGDLEHVVTFYYTGATVFFILAWQRQSYRYAVIAGLIFAGGLWSKPTAGAWALGVILLFVWTVVKLLLERDMPQLRRKFMIAATTGLVSLPIGGMWYVRNLLLGHDPVRMPPDYFPDLALRSGLQFHWLIVLASLAVGYAITVYARNWRQIAVLLLGLVLLLAGVMPSIVMTDAPLALRTILNWIIGQYGQYTPRGPLTLFESFLVIVGLSLLVWQMYPLWRRGSEHVRTTTIQSTLIILPYVVVWFLFYSYHARLMFSFVPILAAMSAALVDAWLIPLMQKSRVRRWSLNAAIAGLGIIGPVVLVGFTMQYVLQGVNTQEEKYGVLNPSLMVMVDAVEDYMEHEGEEELVMYTFNEHRMKMFFPQFSTLFNWEIPTTFDEMTHTPDVLIGGSTAELMWQEVSQVYPNQISAYMAMGDTYEDAPLLYRAEQAWPLLLKPFAEHEGFSHHLIAYEYNPEARALTIDAVQPSFTTATMKWENGVALRGVDFRDFETNTWIQPETDGKVHLKPGEQVYIQLYWENTSGEIAASTNNEMILKVRESENERSVAMLDHTLSLPVSHFLQSDLIPERRVWTVPEQSSGLFDVVFEQVRADGEATRRLVDTGNQFVLEEVIRITP